MRPDMRKYVVPGFILAVLLGIGGWMGITALQNAAAWSPQAFRRIVSPMPDH